MTVKVTTIAAGIDQLLVESAPLVVLGAETVAANASGIVHRRSGKTAESYEATGAVVDAQGVHATAFTDRYTGHLVEWGTAKMAPQAPLRRGAEQAGLRTRLAPKGS